MSSSSSLLLGAFLLCSDVLRAEPVLEPYVFRASFEDGAVGPWSSYPPAQDTAYDPTIWVRPLAREHNVDNRAPVHASGCGTEPREVLVQGNVVRDWTYDSEGELSLVLPDGNGRVELR